MKALHRLFLVLTFISFVSCGVRKSLKSFPEVSQFQTVQPEVRKINDSVRQIEQGFLLKNQHHVWELFTKGNPYQLGLNIGALTEDLYQYQESVFFDKVNELVPPGFKQKILFKLLKYYNRHLYRYISEEYQSEIFGISAYADTKFDYLGNAYHRNLYLHGAHDIGHAFQDLALVGCSSIAVWDENSEDGSLLIGRNFDFYAGDEFAKNKIIYFIQPDQGHAFMSISWAGMIGVVSGMNEKGLTVTLNAGKSSIPLKAKTPISIVAREILQYAQNIDEAIALVKDKEVFVSESILVGSASDKKAVIIEISPDNFGVYEVQNQSNLICSNHFQSPSFEHDKRNNQHIKESHSMYRWQKMNEIIGEKKRLNPKKMADLLRNTEGLDGATIGYGNEKALNQLLAHHAVIFQPEKSLAWVSSPPYQLGEFVAYDLNEIFKNPLEKIQSFSVDTLAISKDIFLNSKEFSDYEQFRKEDQNIDFQIKNRKIISEEKLKFYQSLNPDYWLAHYKVGVYHYENKDYASAKIHFEKALTKEITTQNAEEKIRQYLRKISRKRS